MALTSNPESMLGAMIRVVTTFGEEIEGELFCVDINGSNSVVLCQRLENGNVNYTWTKANIIREVSAIAGPTGNAADEWLPYIDLKQVEGQAKKAEEAAQGPEEEKVVEQRGKPPSQSEFAKKNKK